MRVLLIGNDVAELRPLVEGAGLEIVTQPGRAEAAICFGGDGTLLGAERDYPGLPKVPIRRAMAGDRRHQKTLRAILQRVANGRANETRLPKLLASCGLHRLLALNDVVIKNRHVTAAVRYRVAIDGVAHFGEIVGDGLVAATPFGSSAYYRSITNSVIHVGMGLAFNNSTEPVNHLVLGQESRIRVSITRGPAELAVDNNPRLLPLVEGDTVLIHQAPEVAVIWEIDNLLYMKTLSIEDGRRLRWIQPVAENRRARTREAEPRVKPARPGAKRDRKAG